MKNYWPSYESSQVFSELGPWCTLLSFWWSCRDIFLATYKTLFGSRRVEGQHKKEVALILDVRHHIPRLPSTPLFTKSRPHDRQLISRQKWQTRKTCPHPDDSTSTCWTTSAISIDSQVIQSFVSGFSSSPFTRPTRFVIFERILWASRLWHRRANDDLALQYSQSRCGSKGATGHESGSTMVKRAK